MANAVAKKQETQLQAVEPQQMNEQVLSSDVVIPKLLLMQGLSDFVAERKKSPEGQSIGQGDMVRSTTGEILGSPEKPVEFIPITFKNEWIMQEKIGGKFEYRGVEPRVAANEDAPWEFKKDGAEWRRIKTINVFALLPKDVEAEQKEIENFKKTGEMPDLNKTLLPVLISFRSTSYNAGKSVVTHFTKAAGMAKYGAKPYGFTMVLKCYQDKNDKGAYYVFEAAQGRKASATELAEAEKWYQLLSSNRAKIQVDDTDESAPASGGGSDQF